MHPKGSVGDKRMYTLRRRNAKKRTPAYAAMPPKKGYGTVSRHRSDAQPLTITLDARPQPIALNLDKTAVLVVDMQNDFGVEGGLFHRAGIDLSGIRAVIAPTARVLASARAAGVPIIYIKAGIRADLSDIGEPGSPNRDRWLAHGVGQHVKTARQNRSDRGRRGIAEFPARPALQAAEPTMKQRWFSYRQCLAGCRTPSPWRTGSPPK